MTPQIAPILLLVASNVFMTFAWYGHLKFKTSPLWIAVMASWGIAFVEYWLAVPANRIGSAAYTTAELKTIQEVITLAVFAGFGREARKWFCAFEARTVNGRRPPLQGGGCRFESDRAYHYQRDFEI